MSQELITLLKLPITKIDLSGLYSIGNLKQANYAYQKLKGVEGLSQRAVGVVLSIVNEQKLYLENYSTFEECCKEDFGLVRSRAYELIDYAEGLEKIEMSARADTIYIPKNEHEYSQLGGLEVGEKIMLLKELKELNGSKKINAPVIAQFRKELFPMIEEEDEEDNSEYVEQEEVKEEEELSGEQVRDIVGKRIDKSFSPTFPPLREGGRSEEEEDDGFEEEEDNEAVDEYEEEIVPEVKQEEKTRRKSKSKHIPHKHKSVSYSSAQIRRVIDDVFNKGFHCSACGMVSDDYVDRFKEEFFSELQRLEQMKK